jgi:hypothetical protein
MINPNLAGNVAVEMFNDNVVSAVAEKRHPLFWYDNELEILARFISVREGIELETANEKTIGAGAWVSSFLEVYKTQDKLIEITRDTPKLYVTIRAKYDGFYVFVRTGSSTTTIKNIVAEKLRTLEQARSVASEYL